MCYFSPIFYLLSSIFRALGARDQSRRALRAQLARRGIAPQARAAAVSVLARSGLLDDRRAAHTRAQRLAERGYGDAAIAADLERRGIDRELAAEALAGLEPEADRAVAVAGRRGMSPQTGRFLAGKGFSREAIEAACGADFANDP